MTFLEVKLSDRVQAGFSGGPEWQTLVVPMANGRDRRRQDFRRVACAGDRSEPGFGVGRRDEHKACRRGVGRCRPEFHKIVQGANIGLGDFRVAPAVIGACLAENLIERVCAKR